MKFPTRLYTFCEVMDHIDLNKYLAVKESRTGRPRYDSEKLLKVILFAFMEGGYQSVRNIEKLCKTDIRFMWLLDGDEAPCFMTIDNFMNETLTTSIETILTEINALIIFQGVKFGLREEYAIEYLEEIREGKRDVVIKKFLTIVNFFGYKSPQGYSGIRKNRFFRKKHS